MTEPSRNFTWRELTTTATGLQNAPDPQSMLNLRLLCAAVLEPLRAQLGAMEITSGFRSLAVNQAVGGANSSQHLFGEAADWKPIHGTLEDAWTRLVDCADVLPVDQAIVYAGRARGEGWIHVSHTVRHDPRRELLVEPAPGKRKVALAAWAGPLVLS